MKTLVVTTSATPGTITQVSSVQIRYTWALLKADDDNSDTDGNELWFGHNSNADFNFLTPGSEFVVDAKRERNLDFQNLYVKSAAASQELRIAYLEP